MFDGGRSVGPVAAVARYCGDLVGDVLAFHDFTEDGVAVIEVRSGSNGDEKLAAVGIGSGVGHREFAGLGMLQRSVKFVGEFVAWAAHAGAVRAAALNHEIGNDAVKNQAVVEGP